MKNLNLGKITVPYGAIPHPHELIVAKILIRTGDDVIFIPTSTHTSSDIFYQTLIWEIKSPIGKSSRTIENNLRNALHQSPNIIIDLHRIQIPQNKCLLYIKNHIQNFRGLKRLLIITADNHILKVSPKSACISNIPVLK